MLNRRILRLKAMQALYALEQAQRSNYQLALDYIHQQFETDLNSLHIPSPEEVASKRKLGKELFENNFEQQDSSSLQNPSPNQEVDAVVLEAIHNYNKQLEKERKLRLGEMLSQTEKIHQDYFKLLKLISQFAERSEEDYNERKNRKYNKVITYESELNLFKNQIISHLNHHAELKKELEDISWASEEVREWFKYLKEEAFYTTYVSLPNPSFDEDKDFINCLARDFIFQNKILDAYFETKDIHWTENRSILRNMVLKTLKNIDADTSQVELYMLSRNWEEDKDFFKETYLHTVQDSDRNEEIISKRLQNWDISRVAIMDVIILKMAISEFIHFPSIPVKVTINEYVELAKNYSTPKSKEFVNGILDTISEQLLAEGIIKKSGRGLIDNQ